MRTGLCPRLMPTKQHNWVDNCKSMRQCLDICASTFCFRFASFTRVVSSGAEIHACNQSFIEWVCWSASYLFLHQHFAFRVTRVIVCEESSHPSQQYFTRCTECALFCIYKRACVAVPSIGADVATSSTCVAKHWQHQSQGKARVPMRVFCYVVISLSCLAISGVNVGTVCINT